MKYSIRKVKADYKYNSVKIAKLINYLMKNGKKMKSARNVYIALDKLKKLKKSKDVILLFEKILEKIICKYEIVKLKFGGAVYKCPIISTPFRRESIALRKIVKASRKIVRTKGINIAQALFEELVNILDNSAISYKEKIAFDNMVKSNMSFADLFRTIQRYNKRFDITKTKHIGF